MQNIEEIYQEYSITVYKYLFCLTQNRDISEELTAQITSTFIFDDRTTMFSRSINL